MIRECPACKVYSISTKDTICPVCRTPIKQEDNMEIRCKNCAHQPLATVDDRKACLRCEDYDLFQPNAERFPSEANRYTSKSTPEPAAPKAQKVASLPYIVQKMKGSNKYYACRAETKHLAEYGYGTKKDALHTAAALCGMSYDEYMKLYRKGGGF